MEHNHIVYDADPHFIIDPVTRQLSTQSKKVTLIKGDHNSERFTFEMPKEIDGHDMGLCNRVEVHFINIDQGTRETIEDVYECTDFQVSETDPTKVVYTWLVSRNATKYAGPLSFAIRLACVEGDEEHYAWHTAPYKGITISDGINNGAAVAEKYSDILAEWYGRFVAAEESALANITAHGEAVRASLPQEYSNLVTQTLGNSETQVPSQNAMTIELGLLNGETLNENFNKAFVNGRGLGGNVGAAPTVTTTASRASCPVRVYNEDVFIIPKSGYQIRIFYLDAAGLITSTAYLELKSACVIPAGQAFRVLLYRKDNAVMTNEEARSSLYLLPNVTRATHEELHDEAVLRREFNKTVLNGVAYTGDVGATLKTADNAARAVFPVRQYDRDVFLIPKNGYMLMMFWLDDNNNITAKTYEAIGTIIPKGQRFGAMVYNNGSNTTPMTDDEVRSIVTIRNAETMKENRAVFGAFLDGKFSTIAYSQANLDGVTTLINTAEHYKKVGQTDGFDAIKGDIQITSDDRLVMCHDNGFTFDANGRITTFDASNCTLIRNMTYEQVMALEHAKPVNGVYLHPTDIDALLRMCKRFGKFPYITIRDENMDVIAPILVAKLREYGLETHCIVNSFTVESLATVRQHSEHVFLSQVLQKNQALSEKIVNIMSQYGNVVITMFDDNGSTVDANLEMINYARGLGIRIYSAIFNNTDNIELLLNKGFSGVQSYVPFT